jgi:plastocyanin
MPSRTSILAPSLAALAALLAAAPALAGDKARTGGKTGSVAGAVKYLGKAPTRKPLDRSSDKACARTAALDEEVVVAAGKLRDVHVRIQSGTAGKHAAPATPVVIKQTDCTYRPRLVGAMVGQKVVIENADPTMHNVHAYQDSDTAFNRSQPRGAKPIEHGDLGEAGQVFTLKCDVHAWMKAFIPLTDHPYFAVTGDDGGFVLKDVPAGSYVVEAYHPKLGVKKKPVVVEAGKAAAVDFVFP